MRLEPVSVSVHPEQGCCEGSARGFLSENYDITSISVCLYNRSSLAAFEDVTQFLRSPPTTGDDEVSSSCRMPDSPRRQCQRYSAVPSLIVSAMILA